jgi:hypothetical protein
MKQLLFLPIDINIDLNEFKRTHTETKIPTSPIQPYWDSVALDKQSVLQNSVKQIIDQLPFSSITLVMHKFQTRPVGAHYDVYPNHMKFAPGELDNINENEPCGYRLVIHGSQNVLEVYDGDQWHCPVLPSMPCCYLIDSTRLRHKVKDDPGRELLYFRGIIDRKKHLDLIDRSMKKYSDMALYYKQLHTASII